MAPHHQDINATEVTQTAYGCHFNGGSQPEEAGTTPPRFSVGMDAVLQEVEEHSAKREAAIRAAKEKADHRRDPGLVIDATLLRHRIPEHVNVILARPSWTEGEQQDQRVVFRRVKQVAHSLLLRGYDAEEFLKMMPDYTPPSVPFRYPQHCTDERLVYPRKGARENILWQELTTRGRRRQDPAPKVIKAFKYAQEHIDTGIMPDADKPEYIETLLKTRWEGPLEKGEVTGFLPLDRKVLNFVFDQMRTRNFLKVACPCREVAGAIGVADHKRVWRVLRNLTEDEVLICHGRGEWYGSNRPKNAKAAVYSLAPQVPAGYRRPEQIPPTARSKNQRSQRTKKLEERDSIYGTAPRVNHENTQVKPQKQGGALRAT